jgi:hypothetical protein
MRLTQMQDTPAHCVHSRHERLGSEISDLHAAYRRSRSFSNKVPGEKNSVMEREVKNATRSISIETGSEESEPERWRAFHRKRRAECRSVQLQAGSSRKLVAHNRLRCGGFVTPIYHRSGSDPARVLEPKEWREQHDAVKKGARKGAGLLTQCEWRSRAAALRRGAPAVAALLQLIALNFRLQTSDYNPVGRDSDAVLPNVSVAAVVDSQTGQASRAGRNRTRWRPFAGRAETERYPQGITTNADASIDGRIELAPFGVRVVSQTRLRTVREGRQK